MFGEIAGEDGAARATMTGRQLEDQLLGSQQARELATAADRRAGVAQEAGLFGEIAGQGTTRRCARRWQAKKQSCAASWRWALKDAPTSHSRLSCLDV